MTDAAATAIAARLAHGIALIRKRLAELEGIHARYAAYQQDRVNERDHHGAWDVAINLSETECEMKGLTDALEALGVPVGETDIADHG